MNATHLPYERWPRLLAGVLVVLLMVASYGLSKLSLSPDNRLFYGPSFEPYLELLEFEDRFGSNSRILFIITSGAPLTESERFADAIRWLTDSSATRLEHVTRVDSLATVPHIEATEDDVVVNPLLEAFCATECRDSLLTELGKPHLKDRLANAEGTITGVVAHVDIDVGVVGVIENLNDQIHVLLDEFRLEFPELEVHYTGAVPMMQAFVEAAERDVSGVLAGCFVVVYLLLYLFLGTHRSALLVFGGGIYAVAICLGIAGYFELQLNTATATTPIVVFTLVVASELHLVLHVLRRDRRTEEERRVSVRAAFRDQVRPLTIAAVSSALGLMSLLFVTSPPIQQLGVLAGIGVLIGLFVTLTAIPAFLANVNLPPISPRLSAVQTLLNALARRVEGGKDKFVGAATLGLFLFACLGLTQVQVDDDFVRYFDRGSEFRSNAEYATENLVGPYHLEVVVDTGEESGVFAPESLGFVDDLTNHVRSLDSVRSGVSVADVVREVRVTLAPELEETALDSESIAQLFLAYEMGLQYGQTTTDYLDEDRRLARVSVALRDIPSSETKVVRREIRDWFDRHAPSGFSLQVTGENVPVSELSEYNIRQLLVGIGIALLITSSVLGWYFKRWRYAVVGLVAMIVPVIAGFGIWGWAGASVGLATTMIVAATIGVVIDDGVHLMFRQVSAVRELGFDARESAAYAVHRAGTAVVITTASLMCGFGVLFFSGYEVNSMFGVCASMIFALALIFDLLALPKMLVWAAS